MYLQILERSALGFMSLQQLGSILLVLTKIPGKRLGVTHADVCRVSVREAQIALRDDSRA